MIHVRYSLVLAGLPHKNTKNFKYEITFSNVPFLALTLFVSADISKRHTRVWRKSFVNLVLAKRQKKIPHFPLP